MRRPRLVALVAFTILTACSSSSEQATLHVQPRQDSAARDVQAPRRIRAGIEARYEQIARRAPGFAGFWIDADQAVAYVFVKKGAPIDVVLAEARNALIEMHDRDPGRFGGRVPSVRAVPVEFSYLELSAWRDLIIGRVNGLGIVSWSVDVRANAVSVGVDSGGRIRVVRSQLEKLGIPRGALRVSVAAEPTLTHSP